MGGGCGRNLPFSPERKSVCVGQEGQQNEEQLPAVSVC